MSEENPTPEEIEMSLDLTTVDTLKAQIQPTPEQYVSLAERVKAIDLGRAAPQGVMWEKYSSDLEQLLDLLPKKDAAEPLHRYAAVKAQKYYNKPFWDELYEAMLEFFHGQAVKEYPSPQEKAFWEACFQKYLEMSIKYQI